MVAKIYEAQGNFTSAQKSAFGAIMLALALLLGINFLVGTTPVRHSSSDTDPSSSSKASFQELAKALRPTLKKRIHEESEERRLIDQLESLLSVWKLLRRVWNKPGLRSLAAFSVFWVRYAAHSYLEASPRSRPLIFDSSCRSTLYVSLPLNPKTLAEKAVGR